MYSNGLRIKSANVLFRGKKISAKAFSVQRSHNLVLSLPCAIKGKATILLEFSGRNNDQMYGFYRSTYASGKAKRYVITSDFEPTDARAMFPSFDEPSFKASFDLTVSIDRGMSAISNMPIRREYISAGKKMVEFETTPPMSTYIFHLSVGAFSFTEKRAGRLQIRLATLRGSSDPSLPLDYAAKFIEFYESYFGIKYHLPKVDMIALPDFRAGAMENWGAITFRETRLLCDASFPSAIKERVAEVIAHELAHQWFGDLVTMKWWDDLWLNESFATFMSQKAMDAVFPDWKMKDRFLDMVAGPAFTADSAGSTHPISVKVDDAEHMGELFDEISYEKGCMVLHMIEKFVGEKTFRKGLHRYLMRNRYSNASKEDLWGALQEECRNEGKGRDVVSFARSWIEQPGHPVVSVKPAGDALSAKQSRFMTYGRPPRQRWVVPLEYSSNGATGMKLMRDESALISNLKQPAKLNANQDYFYRVEYGRDVTAALGERVKLGSLSYRDGWGLENDLYSFMIACRVSLDAYLNFVEKYCTGSGYPLAYGTSLHLSSLHGLLYNTSREGDIKAVSSSFHKRLLDECGMEKTEGEPNSVIFLRTRAFSALGLLGYKPVIDAAAAYMRPHGIGAIPPDLRSSVYSIAAWNGSASTFSSLKGMYLRTVDPVERVRLLQALGMFREQGLVRAALGFSFSKAVRLQDSAFIPSVLSGRAPRSSDGIRSEANPAGSLYLWQWLRGNWGSLEKKLPMETHMLDKVMRSLFNVSRKDQLADIERFFSGRRGRRADIEKTLRLAKDSIRANIRFMEQNKIKQYK